MRARRTHPAPGAPPTTQGLPPIQLSAPPSCLRRRSAPWARGTRGGREARGPGSARDAGNLARPQVTTRVTG